LCDELKSFFSTGNNFGDELLEDIEKLSKIVKKKIELDELFA
jgi:hypothetical protein